MNYEQKITIKQREVVMCIKALEDEQKIITLEKIRQELGYNNTSSVQRHTEALIKKGYLEKIPNIRGGLTLINKQISRNYLIVEQFEEEQKKWGTQIALTNFTIKIAKDVMGSYCDVKKIKLKYFK